MEMSRRDALESSLISAAMTGTNGTLFIRSALRGAIFEHPERRAIFEACMVMAEDGGPDMFDLTLLFTEAIKRYPALSYNQFHDYGLATFEASHVSTYCRQIREIDQHQAIKVLAEKLHRDPEPDVDEYILALDEVRTEKLEDVITASQAVDLMMEHRENPAAIHPTGLITLDGYLNGGLQDGQVCVVGGRPGSGKTILMVQMALNAMRNGDAVLLVSLEMVAHEIMERVGKTVSVEKMRTLPLYIIDSTSNLQTIMAHARVTHKRRKIGLIVIDYLQLLEHSGKARSREEFVAGASRAIKRLAQDLRVPIIIGSQLNRATSGVPTLANLRESGAIEQDANIVVLIGEPEDPEGPSTIVLAKNRNGEKDMWQMQMNGSKYQFETPGTISYDRIDEGFNL